MSPIEPSQAPEPVDLRPLGNTGLLTSPVTVGTSFLGDPASADGSPAPGAGGLARAMLDGPYALVDTSNAYAGGRSETALGEAIRLGGLPGGHGVVSKADRDPSTGVLDRDRVLRSFEESISRLGVERIPIFHLHDPYSVPFAEAAAPDGAIEGMLELREQGLVDAIGVAAGRLSVMRDYVGTGVFDVLLNHNRFTLVDRSATALFEEARSRGMGVFNAAPFGGGVLAARGVVTGSPRRTRIRRVRRSCWPGWRAPVISPTRTASPSRPRRWRSRRVLHWSTPPSSVWVVQSA